MRRAEAPIAFAGAGDYDSRPASAQSCGHRKLPVIVGAPAVRPRIMLPGEPAAG